ncbi:hypothetical protein OG394_27790 [Kribbella sp. NBC_01245]|uniref:hypothetical protein n=1 Tax=Kribbella sp. NBC_01245 TaxID=2903578 RepID=UPI002E2A6C4E|nr:hypothetical protein [Kribbella sp. NBC_01245]
MSRLPETRLSVRRSLIHDYEAIAYQHPETRIWPAWVIWKDGHPLAVKETLSEAREWIANEVKTGGRR